MVAYFFDEWKSVEAWYRGKYNIKNKRLRIIKMQYVREWLAEVKGIAQISYSDAVRYQPDWGIMRNKFIDDIVLDHGIIQMGKYRCEVCKGPAWPHYDNTQVDHILPISRGGPEFDVSNLRLVCGKCNSKNR